MRRQHAFHRRNLLCSDCLQPLGYRHTLRRWLRWCQPSEETKRLAAAVKAAERGKRWPAP